MIGRLALLLAFALVSTAPAWSHAQLEVSRPWAEQPQVAAHLRSLSRSRLLLIPRVHVQASSRSLPLNDDFSLIDAEPGEARGELHWSPPRRLLLDRARDWVDHEAAVALIRQERSGSVGRGAGVAIGIVDSGVDAQHAALQNADGSTRIAWFLDFQAAAYGLHAELEAELGCTSGLIRCAILSRADIDRLLQGDELRDVAGREIRLPRDPLGHGTHVASLAAGSETAGSAYAGVAPASELLIANVSGNQVTVEDADVLLATRFIYQQASAAGLPAVVNLSLGGDFGPHDGSSALARALEAFVERPGRALVVAGGNSGALLGEAPAPYPGALGIHTDVHVTHGHTTRVPLLLPADAAVSTGAVFVYIASRSMDELSVGLQQGDGSAVLPYQAAGEAMTVGNDRLQATVINRQPDDTGTLLDTQYGAAVVLSGSFEPGEAFAVMLRGSGNAQLWVQSEGEITSSSYGGALFPGATPASTITVPAAAEALIAVGATWNRQEWPAASGGTTQLLTFASQRDAAPGHVAFFSSRGPNLLNALKPDILAPGAAIVGAMAADAVPVDASGQPNFSSMFATAPVCGSGPECSVVDAAHAVAIGTSMAAPLVSGAAALLLEQQPDLTQPMLKALLQAGARPVNDPNAPRSATAPGLLDIHGSIQALRLTHDAQPGADVPSSQHSWLALSTAFAHPDPEWPVHALLHLRDERGALADASPKALQVEVASGEVTRAPRREAAGLYSFRVAAHRASATRQLRIRVHHRGRLLLEEQLPIAVDSHAAERGVSLRGGCQYGSGPFAGGSTLPLTLAALLLARRRRRAKLARRVELIW